MLNKYYNQSLRYKTQKALEIINHKQDYHMQLMQSIDITKYISKHFGKEIQCNKWMKIQLLPRVSQIFELICDLKIDNFCSIAALKLIIKDFNGSCIHLFVSSKPQIIPIQKCQYRVCKEILIKMDSINLVNNKLYLTIHSTAELTIFKMKYYFITNNRKIQLKKKEFQLPQKRVQINLQELYSLSERKIKIKDNQKNQNLQYNGQLQRGQLLSACLHSLSHQKQKAMKVRQKKQNLEEYRQKSKSLKNITYKCKNLAQEYQIHIFNYRDTNKNTVKGLSTIILMAKFMAFTCQYTKDLSLNNRRTSKQRIIIKKFIMKIQLQFTKLKNIIQNQRIRDLLSAHHFSICAARISYKIDNQKASKIIVTCLMDSKFGVSVNNAFFFASLYRRKIRIIQKCFITRFIAQISMLKIFVDNHSKQLFIKYDHFKAYYQIFHQQNIGYVLSYQYLNDSSCKLNSLFEIYKSKLFQIQQITKINSEINQFNSRSLKKHHKQLLDVPNYPFYPVTRYFRDLNILKSMVRTWFEIQHRKYSKKIRQNVI